MKENNESKLPDSALRAMEKYPRISASSDFNQRVLGKVFAARAPSRLECFCDRMDAIFARPILKLLGAACLGGVLAFAGSGLLIGWSTPAAGPSQPPAPSAVLAAHGDDSLLDSHNRLAMMRQWEMARSLQAEYSARGQSGFDSPTKREKSMEENSPEKRSSQCPVAFASLA